MVRSLLPNGLQGNVRLVVRLQRSVFAFRLGTSFGPKSGGDSSTVIGWRPHDPVRILEGGDEGGANELS